MATNLFDPTLLFDPVLDMATSGSFVVYGDIIPIREKPREFSQTIRCDHCGVKNTPVTPYCVGCGAPL